MPKRENKTEYLQIRIDKKTKELFQIACKFTGVSQTAILTAAINNYINLIMEVKNEP